MDNLLEIIILIVFVLSGLNSLFGKKKKRRGGSENTENAESPAPARKKVPENEIDLLQEIFGIKKESPKSKDPFDEPVTYNQSGDFNTGYNYEDSWNPEDDYQEKQETKASEARLRQKKFEEISQIDYDKVIPVNNYYEDSLEKIRISDNLINKKALQIREILKDNKSVKDSIIIAEVLNKPKAYRRRGNDLLR